jgi:hypothetical protein
MDLDFKKFSLDHYTYINQIFGDQTVREIIKEVFPNPMFEFKVELADEEFDYSDHHVLYNTKTKKTICSSNSGVQNTNKNINDSLCQSYSLLTYFGLPIGNNRRLRQNRMIEMYRMLLGDSEFMNIVNRDILKNPANKKIWTNYADPHPHSKNTTFVNMSRPHLVKNIRKTLDDWEEYGYMYFIGTGEGA